MTAEQIIQAVNDTVPSEKYMKEVERLTENPHNIVGSWFSATPLFGFVMPTFAPVSRCGCLTQIKMGIALALTSDAENDENLTNAIRMMPLPSDENNIKPEDLLLFAKAQTFLDKYYGREAQ